MFGIKKLLTDKKIRVTKNKIKLLGYLINKNCPVTAVEIIGNFSKESSLNKSTVYRIMDELCEKGLIFKFLSENGEYMYCFGKGEGKSHVHLVCDKCGDYYCKNINLDKILNNFDDFQTLSVNATFHGICSRCKK
ncbi:transcriptional repressor [Deferribacterales bacterium Es71-Z0220]|jgi:Fur family ferric uptake transcriptional regulator|uniref:Fur family transcriptional regulator n=1 Tax=Deferrivibrio essentukiensis TaxID=2880922 RepID=UPI001F620509|nr:transcriptional repressor [Deferrivibrio essentukiensis]MCB4204978.1 transcriptional repressor [Deferrivibrio essentukiensis]